MKEKVQALKKFSAILLTLTLVFSIAFQSYENVQAASVSAPSVGQCTTTTSNLNIRSSASTSASIVASLAPNAYIQVIGTSGDFYKVYYNTSGGVGYCSKSYLSIASTKYGTASTSGSNLNLRASASTSATILASVPNGTALPIISTSGDWHRVVYGVTVGYVSSSYFVTGSTTPTPTPVPSNDRANIVAYAKTLLGIWYEYGGDCIANPSAYYGLDCSHFTYQVLKKYGYMDSYRTSANQATWATAITKSELQPGDLVFYKNAKGVVEHVTLYIGNNQIIGANGGNSSTDTIEEAKAKDAKVKIASLDSDSRTKIYGRAPKLK